MAFSFDSIGHFFASAVKDVWTFLKGAEAITKQIEQTQPLVEGVIGLVSGGAKAVEIERAAFSILGKVIAVLSALGDATEKVTVTLSKEEVAEIRTLCLNCNPVAEKLGVNLLTAGNIKSPSIST